MFIFRVLTNLKVQRFVMYKLKNKIFAHGSDVRTMDVVNSNRIVTGSRDFSCKVFHRETISSEFAPIHTTITDQRYVNSCTHFVFDDKIFYIFGTGLSVLYVYNENFELLYTLEGHSKNVSCIDCCYRKNHIASGSWDCTINIWDMNFEGKLIDSLHGHEQAVWCLKYVAGFNLLLSGSADKTIRLWKNYNHVKTFTGHKHAVRDLAVLKDKRTFLSCGNDMTIIKWDIISGTPVQTVGHHSSFIYSLALIDQNNFVSAGEDGEIIVWNGMQKFQEIKIPCTSVWKIVILTNQELVAACSDGVIRIYTNDESFTEIIKDEQLAVPQKSTPVKNSNCSNDSNDKIANARSLEDDPNIPDASVGLLLPGKTDGQVTLVRNQGKVQVYEWSAKENCWKPFGDVLSNNEAISSAQNISNKIYFEGKEYDYVFDVDLEGQRMLKLPYNHGDDEWDVSQKFIAKHNLNSIYIEQIVNFIKSNVNQKPSPTPNKVSFTLHKFKVTNMPGLYRKLLESSSSPDISNENVLEIKSSAEKILNSIPDSSNNQGSITYAIKESFPWSVFFKAINGTHDVNVVPFLDLLRVFSLDYDFTTKFIQDNQLTPLIGRYLLNNADFNPTAVMLVLKSLCNMIFVPTDDKHCALMAFFIEQPENVNCFNNALLWLTQRCHVSLSTLLYNMVVYFFLTAFPSDCVDIFHQTVNCLTEGFHLTEYTFDDESLLRLFTSMKILASFHNQLWLSSDEKSKLNNIVEVFVNRKPHDTNLYHSNADISNLILELIGLF